MNLFDKRLDAYKKSGKNEVVPELGKNGEKSRAQEKIVPQKTVSPDKIQRNFEKADPSTKTDLAVSSDSLHTALERNGLLKIPENLRDSTYRRVAKFLLLIGVDEASKVLKHLTQEQIDKVVPEIASIRNVDRDEAAVILAEFETLMQRSRESGGVETARTILEKAFGSDLAGKMLEKSVPFPDGKPFDYLQEMDGERLHLLLKDETAPVRALVLSYVKPAAAADTIKRMNPDEKADTVRRLAKLQAISPDIIRRVDRAMNEKVQRLHTHSGGTIDGRSALAEILRRMDPQNEKDILSHLSGSDPELEADLKSRLFTLDDVVKIDDRYLQKTLSGMKEEDIAVLIAGKPEDFRAKLFANMSKGRGDLILEEESLRVPIPRKESERVTSEFVSKLRSAWEAGKVALKDREDDVWVQ